MAGGPIRWMMKRHNMQVCAQGRNRPAKGTSPAPFDQRLGGVRTFGSLVETIYPVTARAGV
jgi:hypothetical protein